VGRDQLSLWQLGAARFTAAQCGVIAVLFVCVGLGMAELLALLAVCVVTLACAARLPPAFAVVLGVVAWAYFTGFAVNRYGALTFTGPDLARLSAVLLLCAATAHWRR
jgi:hypothetical protein